MKKIVIILISISPFSYAQNTSKSIRYDRSYYTNESIVTSYTDQLKMNYNFKNNYGISSCFLKTNLNFFEFDSFDDEKIQDVYSFDVAMSRKMVLKNNLYLNFEISPQFRSNFSAAVNSNDFLLNGIIGVKKEFNPNSTVYFAATYGTLLGKPSAYLEFAYDTKINTKLNLSIGFPKTNLEYRIDKSHSLTAESEYQGYYTTVSKNSISRVLEGTILNYKSVYFTRINAVLIYKYKFMDSSIVDFSIGKSFRNQLEIEESNHQLTKVKFNNSFTVSMGFKYNLNFK